MMKLNPLNLISDIFQKSWVRWTVKIFIGCALMYLLYRWKLFNPEDLIIPLQKPYLLFSAILCIWGGLALSSYRWHLLLVSQGVNIKLWDVFSLNLLGSFGNNFLPGGAGGDAIRIICIIQKSRTKRLIASASIIVDRLLGLFGLLTLAIIAFLLSVDKIRSHSFFLPMFLVLAVLIFVSIMIIFAGMLMHKYRYLADKYQYAEGRVRQLIARTILAFGMYSGNVRVLAYAFLLSILIQLFAVATLYLVDMAMDGGSLTLSSFALAATFSILVNIIPVSPGGLGLGEGAFGQLAFMLAKSPLHVGYATIFLVFRTLSLICTLPGIVFYRSSRIKNG